jgi:heme oxygenase
MQSGQLTAEQYRHLLRTHYLFHSDLEATIDRHSARFTSYDPDSRRKTPALLADFDALRETPPTTGSVGMHEWSPDALLGAAYVSEGSMLGVTMVGPMLRKNPALADLTDAMHFYGGYGPDTARNWKAFGQLLATVPHEQYDAVAAGADAAFRRYQQLFAETDPLSTAGMN